ncbi:MAG: hypothetical protein K0R13_1418 [Propionibacteriaceae bacterium]|nr:hypothetical protein [Propionibacteriaceae bacterium]MDF2746090.1 hypothetical protein [Propionibacteriaceae bacterium]
MTDPVHESYDAMKPRFTGVLPPAELQRGCDPSSWLRQQEAHPRGSFLGHRAGESDGCRRSLGRRASVLRVLWGATRGSLIGLVLIARSSVQEQLNEISISRDQPGYSGLCVRALFAAGRATLCPASARSGIGRLDPSAML